ncbi:hypothetical protein ACFQ6V_30890 [Streptomyces roseifaciens]
MPTNAWDATVKQLYFADHGTIFTADTIKIGDEYDVIADVEIGGAFHQIADEERLIVTVTNRTTNQVIETKTLTQTVPASQTQTPLRKSLTIVFGPLLATQASDGDELQARCSYKFTGGAFTRTTRAESQSAIVDGGP